MRGNESSARFSYLAGILVRLRSSREKQERREYLTALLR
jgi:hypothetical protein